MSSLRRVFAFLAAVLVFAVVSPARAQTAPTIKLGTNPVTHLIPRTHNRTNEKINYADCISDDVLTFSLVLTNRGTNLLQAWAGTACDMLANRTNTNTTLCWKLYDALPSSTSNPNAPTVDIHVRDLLAGKTVYGAQSSSSSGGSGGTDAGGTGGTGGTSVGGTGGSGGTDTGGTGGSGGDVASTGGTTGSNTPRTLPTGTLVTGTGEEACIDNSAPVVVPITIYFMLVDGNFALQSGVTWAGNYKLVAPNPPDNVSVDIGEGLLPVHFSYANNQSSDTTINGYNIFCDPPPGRAAAADAGLIPTDTTDAGDDAGVVVGQACGSDSKLVAGEIADQAYLCGTASLSATAGIASGLVNGVPYHIGVSATDTYDNTGKLSVVKCNVPQPVNGFFKAYRAAGGQGGGGFCSFSMKREPMPLLALLGLASCLVLRRRKSA